MSETACHFLCPERFVCVVLFERVDKLDPLARKRGRSGAAAAQEDAAADGWIVLRSFHGTPPFKIIVCLVTCIYNSIKVLPFLSALRS